MKTNKFEKLADDLNSLKKPVFGFDKKNHLKSKIFTKLKADSRLLSEVCNVSRSTVLDLNSKARIKESLFEKIENSFRNTFSWASFFAFHKKLMGASLAFVLFVMTFVMFRVDNAVVSAASISYISSFEGDVFLYRDGEALQCEIGFVVEEGDQIITADDSVVEILFFDDSKARLAPNSHLSIDVLFEENIDSAQNSNDDESSDSDSNYDAVTDFENSDDENVAIGNFSENFNSFESFEDVETLGFTDNIENVETVSSVELNLLDGRIWSDVVDLPGKDSSYVLKVSDTYVSAESASFDVELSNDEVYVAVFDDSVNVTNNKDADVVESGEKLLASDGNLESVPLEDEDVQIVWVEENISISNDYLTGFEERLIAAKLEALGDDFDVEEISMEEVAMNDRILFLTIDDVETQIDIFESVNESLQSMEGDFEGDDFQLMFEDFNIELEEFERLIEEVSYTDQDYADELRKYLDESLENNGVYLAMNENEDVLIASVVIDNEGIVENSVFDEMLVNEDFVNSGVGNAMIVSDSEDFIDESVYNMDFYGDTVMNFENNDFVDGFNATDVDYENAVIRNDDESMNFVNDSEDVILPTDSSVSLMASEDSLNVSRCREGFVLIRRECVPEDENDESDSDTNDGAVVIGEIEPLNSIDVVVGDSFDMQASGENYIKDFDYELVEDVNVKSIDSFGLAIEDDGRVLSPFLK